MVGPFRVLQLIAQGEKSIVFRAERGAGFGTQVAALKVLLTSVSSPEAQRSFLREQATLAQLSHPDIARLIEAGVSASGLPFIAMEYFEGVSLTSAANTRGLNLKERLRLFVRLCRAVDAAHVSLIAHRDLKPSNVLVDVHGALKVLDFGVARFITSRGTSKRSSTDPKHWQRDAEAVATDIRALAGILGELLVGIDLRSSPKRLSESLGEVRELPPGLPTPVKFQRQSGADLDTIWTRATSDDSTHRYRTVDALANDVERYLSGYPLDGNSASRGERVVKFVARHRIASTTVALLGLGLLASLALALVATQRAVHQAAQAQAAAARADSLRDFMLETFSDAEHDPAGTAPATIVDAVEHALSSIVARNDLDANMHVELQTRLAQVLSAQGSFKRASDILNDANDYAAAHLRADDPQRLKAEHLVANNLFRRGNLDSAREGVDAVLSRLPVALTTLRAEVLTTSAFIAARQHDIDRGLRDARTAVELARNDGGHYRVEQALRALGAVLIAAETPDEAVSVYQDLVARARAQYGPNHVRVAAEKAALSRAYRLAGEFDKAEAEARAAIEIDDKAFVGPHPDKAIHLNALMMVQMVKRNFSDALATNRAVLDIDQQILGADHPDTLLTDEAIGRLYGLLGDNDASVEWERRALDGFVRKGLNHSWFGINTRARYGYALVVAGQRKEGLAQLATAFEDADTLGARDAAQLKAQVLERTTRIALDDGDEATAAREITRYQNLGPIKADEALSGAHLALLKAELLLLQGKRSLVSPELNVADRFAVRVRPADALVATTTKIFRALSAAEPSSQEARGTAREAREAFANLRYPPAFLSHYAKLIAN